MATASRIRVLVVDDSAVIRHVVTTALKSDPGIEVVGTASNGRLALERIEELTPDVVTMDIEMPVMDGLSTLVELRPRWPRLPVIMFSALTERGATATVEALSRGASDYMTKPSGTTGLADAAERIRAELIPKIKALCQRRQAFSRPASLRPARVPDTSVVRHCRVTAPPVPAAGSAPTGAAGPIDVIAIGVSTGGPAALSQLIPALPANLPVPVLIVQHMPPMFTTMLADRLNTASSLTVVEATSAMAVRPGQVYVAPGDHHLGLQRKNGAVWTLIDDAPRENSCRPAVDVLFRYVASHYGGRSLGVMLTGMGHDGLEGSRGLCRLGARIIAQDEASSVVWGMPGAVVHAGIVERVLPLDALADEIARRASVGRSGARVAG